MWNDTVGRRNQFTYSNVLPVCEDVSQQTRVPVQDLAWLPMRPRRKTQYGLPIPTVDHAYIPQKGRVTAAFSVKFR